MSNIKKILIIFTGILLFFSMLILWEYYDKYGNIIPVNTKTLKIHGIDSAEKLMITAHPDDEVLWGGGHLMDKGYFIVVITNGKNRVRKNEFQAVVESSGNSGIILDYPDKSFGVRSNWKTIRNDISEDIQKIIDYKKWKIIVTHNENGEYGHIHHKMTHEIVKNIYDNDNRSDTKLYFFGRYYKKSDIDKCEKSVLKMEDERIEFKENLLKLYRSQKNTIKKLSHMNCYEDWTEKSNEN